MMAIAGSFYLISTYAFVFFCTAAGVRLVLLARRNGTRPELLLGGALALMGGFGYGGLITMSFARLWLGPEAMAWIPSVSVLAKAVHDFGVLLMIGFIVTVFRPTERWARALAGVMAAALVVGNLGHTLNDGFRELRSQTSWYWLGFATIGTVPLWNGIEAFLYHGQMKKRAALGLADAAVVNRFLLWTFGSAFSFLAIWTVSLPSLLGLPIERQTALTPLTLSLTGIWGIGAIGAYWLAFFPPAWYARRLKAPGA
jgi:hypothetical protein